MGTPEPPPVAPGVNDLIITEVACQPTPPPAGDVYPSGTTPVNPPKSHIKGYDFASGSLGQLEFVELLNTSTSKLDLSAVVLTVTYDHFDYPGVPQLGSTIALSGTLAPGKRLVVARNAPLITALWPAAQVIAAPTLHLNSYIPRTKADVLLKSGSMQVSLSSGDATQTFGANLGNFFLHDAATTLGLSARKTSWGTYEYYSGSGSQGGHYGQYYVPRGTPNAASTLAGYFISKHSPATWGTPGLANELRSVADNPSSLKGKLIIKEVGEGTRAQRVLWFKTHNSSYTSACLNGDLCESNSTAHIEIKNVSDEAVDVTGLVLEVHAASGKAFHTLVIGHSPLNTGFFTPTDLVSLVLQPRQSIVVTRNAADVALLLKNKVRAGTPVFAAVANLVVNSHPVAAVWKVTPGQALSYGGFVVEGDIPGPAGDHAGSKHHYTFFNQTGPYFVLRDRTMAVVDQAGNSTAGFVSKQTEWQLATTPANAARPASDYTLVKTVASAACGTSTRSDVGPLPAQSVNTCALAGYVMEEAQ